MASQAGSLGLSGGRAAVVANGVSGDLSKLKLRLERCDFIAAADGGANYLYNLGIAPGILIGDLDSVKPEVLQWCVCKGTEVIRYPAEKDETDLQLGLTACMDKGYKRIDVLAALGGRLDHLLTNLTLMIPMIEQGIDCAFIDDESETRIISSEYYLKGKPGDIISLIPLRQPVVGVTTEGLKYPLVDDMLSPGVSPLGVSNVLMGENCRISVRHGLLLLIHIRPGGID
jgi:thiamine pyrophosphokinase